MKNVYLFTEDTSLKFDDIKKLFPNDNAKYRLFVNNFDYASEHGFVVVFGANSRDIETYIPNSNRLLILGECDSIRGYTTSYLNQFGKVIGAHSMVKGDCRICPGHGWFFDDCLDDLYTLKPLKKKFELSIVTSNKVATRGHRERLEFCRQLAFDLRCEQHLFGRGIKTFSDKWSVLRDYKYTVAIENSQQEHWITEKLTDPFLSYTFPFYYGAPNIFEYYPKKSLQNIDISNYNLSKRIIENILNQSSHYSEHISDLIVARTIFLDSFIFSRHLENFVLSSNAAPPLFRKQYIFRDPGRGKKNMFFRKIKKFLSDL